MCNVFFNTITKLYKSHIVNTVAHESVNTVAHLVFY